MKQSAIPISIILVLLLAVYIFASLKCERMVVFSPQKDGIRIIGDYVTPKEYEHYYIPIKFYNEHGSAKEFKSKSDAKIFCTTQFLWL